MSSVGVGASAEPDSQAVSRDSKPPAPGRDLGIDALRGFAVLTMVGANMAPYLLTEPYPFWFRVWSSAAAPLFVFLAGMMVGMSRARNRSKTLSRCGALLLIAALIDWGCWSVIPFTTFDVLYVIALALPICHVGLKLPPSWQYALITLVLGVTPVLHQLFGYGADNSGVFADSVQALFVDGWFPLFPWLAISLFGARVGQLRTTMPAIQLDRRIVPIGLGACVVGGILWALVRPTYPTRGGYAELFYPPSLASMLFSLGGVLIAVVVTNRPLSGAIAQILATFGRRSLLLYVTHIMVIAGLIRTLFQPRGYGQYFAVYAGHTLALWALAATVQFCVPKPRSFFGRLLLGG